MPREWSEPAWKAIIKRSTSVRPSTWCCASSSRNWPRSDWIRSPTFRPTCESWRIPERLRGILLTLVSNAIRFTEPGGHVMIDVGYPEGMPEDVVMIRVGDSGCGIPIERQQDIFEPSAPARHPAESNSGGAGPGLVDSRRWAREMGGDLRVRSDVDRGSVFTLKLPRA